MLGIMRRRPWDAVKVVAERPGLQGAVDRPGRPGLGLHLHDLGHGPHRLRRPWADQSSASSPMVDEGVIG